MVEKRQRAPWRNKIRSIEEIREYLLRCRVIDHETGCWEWPFSGKPDGSGQMACWLITKKRRPVLVRRIAAFLWHGFDINSDLIVAPRCENKSCFNPDHLSIGSMTLHRRSVAIQKGRVLSDAKLKEVIELLRLKMHPGRIARLTGVTRPVVVRIKTLRSYKRECRKFGWTGDHERAKRRLSNQDVFKIKELLAQGRTQGSIAKIYNVHYSTICRIHKGNRRQTALQQEAANVG